MQNPLFPGRIAVLDVETTGLNPFRHDRIIEIAAVIVSPDGQIEREFVSLVNPLRDIGPSRIHGLAADDLLHAPEFENVVDLLIETIDGCIAIAGHNVRFDKTFIESEFQRLGHIFPDCNQLCTLRLAGGGKLIDCCENFGVSFDGDAHSALSDARAAAKLLVNLVLDQPSVGQRLLGLSPISWPKFNFARRNPITRLQSQKIKSGPPVYLQRLHSNVWNNPPAIDEDSAVLDYVGLIGRVLEDKIVDEDEADALIECAGKWGMNWDQIQKANDEYLKIMLRYALDDGEISELEFKELGIVARLLGKTDQDLKTLIIQIKSDPPGNKNLKNIEKLNFNDLEGKSVCFTGELIGKLEGEFIERNLAEKLAHSKGLVVRNSVTKNLDILVVADPHTQSGKAKKARSYGIRIIHESVFWKMLNIKVD